MDGIVILNKINDLGVEPAHHFFSSVPRQGGNYAPLNFPAFSDNR